MRTANHKKKLIFVCPLFTFAVLQESFTLMKSDGDEGETFPMFVQYDHPLVTDC